MEKKNIFFGLGLALALVASCTGPKKLEEIRAQQQRANLALPAERAAELRQYNVGQQRQRDTLIVKDDEGNDLIFMKTAVVDGEAMASEVLDAAVVTARFRNVAERHGKIDIEFDVIVPKTMMDSKWQITLFPDMFVLGDSTRLDPVQIAGYDYRKAQLKGYEKYAKYLSSIVSDTTSFYQYHMLELFIERNMPEFFSFSTDSTEVSDDEFIAALQHPVARKFSSRYGATVDEAIQHYSYHIRKRINNRRIGNRDRMYRKYVKAPFESGLRLDTVIQEINGDFRYRYVQSVATKPKLRKIDVTLCGDIREAGRRIYDIPRSDSLTFYVSSVSTLLDNSERYLTKVIERKAEANTACYIQFPVGKADIDESLGHNATEMGRIKQNLRDIMGSDKFDLDSISITAYASPEGMAAANGKLSAKRAESTSKFFNDYMKRLTDSLRRDAGMTLVIGDDGMDNGRMQSAYVAKNIKFLSHNGGENWKTLDYLVDTDTLFNSVMKEEYFDIRNKYEDVDVRESALQAKPFYKDLRSRVYPYCRIVSFDFHMSRRGMIKDTIHTTVLDSTYMDGVQAIRDRDYEKAVALLHEYQDYNTAVAYVALDRNQSAMRILEKLDRTASVDYLMAILHSREGDDQKAVQRYLDACKKDRSFVNRGNLDPEISVLIKRYNLNKEPDDDEFADLLGY